MASVIVSLIIHYWYEYSTEKDSLKNTRDSW